MPLILTNFGFPSISGRLRLKLTSRNTGSCNNCCFSGLLIYSKWTYLYDVGAT
jgi:hypothetical protein